MPDATDTETRGLSSKHLLGAFVFQAVMLAAGGWVNRHALNPDGVAYLRLASYYAEGKTELAVSGYWGPLLSWLIAPWLKSGMAPLLAARILMALSAVFFLSGCLRVFRAFGMAGSLLRWGMWAAALVSGLWSVENITPDLLLAGLICFAFAPMVTERWLDQPFVSFGSGLGWGIAFLCKAIALPLALLTSIGIVLLWRRKRPVASRQLLRNLGLTLLGLTVIAAPWIAVLSAKYGRLTVSNSARLNHSFVGPTVVKPVYLLDQGFRRPDAGRVTIWEDPFAPYPDWSPFAGLDNARRQLEVIARNVPIVLAMLTSVSLAFPLLFGGALWLGLRRKVSSVDPSMLAWVPIIALGVLFLPNYLLISEQRYFYPAFPLLWVIGAGALSRMSLPGWIQRWGPALLAIALVLPTFGRAWLRPGRPQMAGDCAYELAAKIRAGHFSGPLAGSAKMPGGRAGLYVAYHLDQPWFGDEPAPTAASCKSSGAALIVVIRDSSLARELAADAWFRDLDVPLFGSAETAGRFPLRVFKNLSAGTPSGP